jgi:hypothetical protein
MRLRRLAERRGEAAFRAAAGAIGRGVSAVLDGRVSSFGLGGHSSINEFTAALAERLRA